MTCENNAFLLPSPPKISLHEKASSIFSSFITNCSWATGTLPDFCTASFSILHSTFSLHLMPVFFSIISVASLEWHLWLKRRPSMALLPPPGSKELHYFFKVLLLPVPLGHCPSCLRKVRASVAPWVQNNPPPSLPPSSLCCSFFLCLGTDPGKSGSMVLPVGGWKAQWH